MYLIEILHQTTTLSRMLEWLEGCILSKFYIKPQPLGSPDISGVVVSYRNSTSNHNAMLATMRGIPVVSYRNSTSNHNAAMPLMTVLQLYLIEILHQTTTTESAIHSVFELYLIEILHQTTTLGLILIDKVLLTGCLPL